MAAAAADPPGYFVGRPLHYQEPPPAAENHNAVTPQVPGYYSAPVAKPKPASPAPAHNSATDSSAAADASAVEANTKPGFFSKWFGGCFSSGENGS